MNKHDELIERLNWRANKLAGPGWLMHNCVNDLRDAQRLLQLYGDALVRLGDENKPMDSTLEHMTYFGRSEMNSLDRIGDYAARIKYAQKTVEAGYIEEHTEITKEQWDSIKTTVEGE